MELDCGPLAKTRVQPRRIADDACPEAMTDLRSLMTAIGPLGDLETLSRHSARCPTCFARLRDLFFATAPDASDPAHRLVDGLNQALYRLAKAVLWASSSGAPEDFLFDRSPGEVLAARVEARDRLDALQEYTEGRSARAGTSAALDDQLREVEAGAKPSPELAEAILKRAVSIGGRYGLDAANLLGYLRYRRGDLAGAELLFTTVIRRNAFDSYERETQAHAMNNLTGVYLCRGELKSAILWCERSLMLKERLGIDARSNYVNLMFFWLEHQTSYGVDRARHYLRTLLRQDEGKSYLERALAHPEYLEALVDFRAAGLDREFPEIRLPALAPVSAEPAS